MVTTIGLTGAARETSPARSGANRYDCAEVTLISATCDAAFVAGPVLVVFRAVTFRCCGLSNRFTLGSSPLTGELPVFSAIAGTIGAGTVALFSLVAVIEGAGVLFL